MWIRLHIETWQRVIRRWSVTVILSIPNLSFWLAVLLLHKRCLLACWTVELDRIIRKLQTSPTGGFWSALGANTRRLVFKANQKIWTCCLCAVLSPTWARGRWRFHLFIVASKFLIHSGHPNVDTDKSMRIKNKRGENRRLVRLCVCACAILQKWPEVHKERVRKMQFCLEGVVKSLRRGRWIMGRFL